MKLSIDCDCPMSESGIPSRADHPLGRLAVPLSHGLNRDSDFGLRQRKACLVLLGRKWENFPSPIALIHHTRSEEHTSELQSHLNLVCRLLLEKKKRTVALVASNVCTHSNNAVIHTS